MSQRKDLAVKKFLEKPENFSDLFNGSIFCGRQVLRADMLERLPGESALTFPDKAGQKVSERRYRDAICKASGSTTYAVFAVEGQEKTHYAMPVREMLYDALNYAGQIKELTDRHRREKDYNNSAEFRACWLRTGWRRWLRFAFIMGHRNGMGRGSYLIYWIYRKSLKI